MAKFTYQAYNNVGKKVSGVLDADSPDNANQILVARGYIPINVKRGGSEKGGSGFFDEFSYRMASVKAPDLILYSKQIGSMIRSGIPFIRVFQILENQTENLKLKRVTGSLLQDIQQGEILSEAFAKHKNIFNDLYVSMIKSGEVSGALSEVLERLIYIIEHEHKIKSDIKSAMTYPVIVMITLSIAFFVLLNFVVPQFIKIFEKAHLDLPMPTRVCVALSKFLTGNWYIILAAVVGLVMFSRYYFKTDQGKYMRDAFFLKIPIIGPLLIKAVMSRFASIFSILQSSGVHVLDTMNILSDTIGNKAISSEFDKLKDSLRDGRGISGPLSTAKYFTPMVINMVAIGEESGNLDQMLKEIASHYDSEVTYAMHKLTEAIGPILTLALAGVVGFFALAIFLPMWDLVQTIK